MVDIWNHSSLHCMLCTLHCVHRLVGKRGPLFAPLKDHTGIVQLLVMKDEVSTICVKPSSVNMYN